MSDGTTDDLKGRAKEAAGDLTDDKSLKNEGKVDRASGSIKDKVGDAADSLKGARLFLGFNRRFDPNHRYIHKALREGAIGQRVIESRAPHIPSSMQQLTTEPLAGEAGRAGHQRSHVSPVPGAAPDLPRPSSR